MTSIKLLVYVWLAVIVLTNAHDIKLSVDLHQTSLDHHTEKFTLSSRTLVVRRGGNISLVLEGDGNITSVGISILLNEDVIDSFQIEDQGAPVAAKLNWTATSVWEERGLDDNKTSIAFSLYIPVKAAVGIYYLSFASDGRTLNQSAYVLFNPWNDEDETFLISEAERNEYVLNDIGKVYLGSSSSFGGKEWIFGQFHETTLPAVMLLLSKTPLINMDVLSDAVLLSRAISAGVNANDGFGVLEGKWEDDYSDGTNPTAWMSSVAILDEYFRSGGEPVKYAQCWVFAAVTTTVLRTLGIPARPVTTFGSAHDTDNSLTIDHFFDENMDEITETYGSDSVWNFHAWTEAWMLRDDIHNRTDGGWQVVDATPQELSDDIFQAGPASIAGVRRGDIDSNYDMHFVFSEVQSYEVRWKVDLEKPIGWKRLSSYYKNVGNKIVTKALGKIEPGVSDAVDITYNYKFEDLEERRLALMNAAKRAGVELLFHDKIIDHGVEFTFSPLNQTTIGAPLTGFVSMINKLNHTVNVSVKVRIDSTYYNAVKMYRIATVRRLVQLEPNQEEVVEFHVPFEDYFFKLLAHNLVAIYASAIVTETDQIWVHDADLSLRTPDVKITLKGEAKRDQITEFRFEFQNPLPIPLSDCQLLVHGTRPYMRLKLNDIAAGETVVYGIDILIDHIPLIVADINCAEVSGMSGSTLIAFND